MNELTTVDSILAESEDALAKEQVRVEYSSNNSGGNWWLTDDDWLALEAAGWTVQWVATDPFYKKFGGLDKNGRWLGCLAKYASKEFDSLEDGVEEFERITAQRASDAGCPCCGPPHNFTAYRGDKWESYYDDHDYVEDY